MCVRLSPFQIDFHSCSPAASAPALPPAIQAYSATGTPSTGSNSVMVDHRNRFDLKTSLVNNPKHDIWLPYLTHFKSERRLGNNRRLLIEKLQSWTRDMNSQFSHIGGAETIKRGNERADAGAKEATKIRIMSEINKPLAKM